MTVKRFGADGVLIDRRDTAGKYAGLVATYTGTWNGKRIVDGKLTRIFKSGPVVYGWIASLE
jgi:ribosomal protein L35AE/L33A